MRYSVPASRNGLPLNIGTSKSPAYYPATGTSPRKLPTKLYAVADLLPLQITGSAVPPPAVLDINRGRPDNVRGAIPGTMTIRPIGVTQNRGEPVGALQPGSTTTGPSGTTGGRIGYKAGLTPKSGPGVGGGLRM